MLRWIVGLLIDADEPPERLGVIGVAILAIFAAFCAAVGFTHTPPTPIPWQRRARPGPRV